MTHESNKSSKSRTRAMLQKKWSVTPLKDELSGNLSYEFIFPVGDGTMGSLELGNELSTGEMSRRLARRTTLLPKPGAEAFIQKLIGAASGKFVIKAGQPGWKRSPLSSDKAFVAFVTPGQIIGPGAALFRSAVPLNSRPHLGQQAGEIDDWSDSIGKVAELSNYIAFAIMAALAGPLLRFAELPEDPAFNFVGPSSGGKTRAAMAGASALGHPAAISSWDLTERAVEEAAAARNDCFLVLNAAEKASPKRRREVLNRIVHMVAERQSTVRSESVQDRLPNLAWRTLLLTTSNKTGAEMANDQGFPWREQEAVRFIDIPVPGPDDGGVFDRLENATDKAAKSTKLIRELEKDLMKYYGVLLRPWIEHLLATRPWRRVARLIRRFEEKTGPHTGVEDRIARKFGLLYAAGRIAVEAGLLKWSTGLPLRATTALYRRAKQLRLNGDGQVSEALTKLAEALADPAVVPPAAPRARVKVSDEKAFLGVRYRLNGKQVVGLRKEKLAQLVGDAMVGPVLKRLNERGAIIKGHGGKSTQQLSVVLQVGGRTLSKPRFIVVDPKHLPA